MRRARYLHIFVGGEHVATYRNARVKVKDGIVRVFHADGEDAFRDWSQYSLHVEDGAVV